MEEEGEGGGGGGIASVAAVTLSSGSSLASPPPPLLSQHLPSPFNYSVLFPSLPAVPFFVGASSQAEPSCDIVCHCGITALASRHEQAGDAEKATLAACALLCHGVRTLRLEKQLAGKKKN